MSVSLPFTISPEAEHYLRTRSVPTGNEAGLSVANNFELRDHNGTVTDRHVGLHFTIGFAKAGFWSGTRVAFGDIEFWIPATTLKELRGKTLTLIRRYEGEKHPGKIQNLLVAV